MNRQIRFQVIRGNLPVGEEHILLQDAVLIAASHDGHAATFARDRHGFMCFYASRRPVPARDYVPVPCDAFRPWSPLKDETDAKEEVAKKICDSGIFHFRHKDIEIVTLTYENDVLTALSDNAPEEMLAMRGRKKQD